MQAIELLESFVWGEMQVRIDHIDNVLRRAHAACGPAARLWDDNGPYEDPFDLTPEQEAGLDDESPS